MSRSLPHRHPHLPLNGATVLVVGTADWDQPIATNQHYMTRELARDSRVWFMESLGLRRMELRARDLRRALRRLMQRGITAKARTRPPGFMLVSPVVVPVHTKPWTWANWVLIRFALRRWLRGGQARVLWTYSPIIYGLDRLASVVVYHCVDLLGAFPGVDSAVIDAAEKKLAQNRAVKAVASSSVVKLHLENQGFRDVVLWPNVADTEIFDRAMRERPGRRDRVVFAGNLTATKVDFELLGDLVSAGVDLHLAGPISEGGGNNEDEIRALVNLGASYHGVLSLEELASLFSTCKVGLIPYVDNEYTQGVSPLKTFEYLAAGIAVVATDLPGVPKVEHVAIAIGRDEFLTMVQEAILTFDDEGVAIRAEIASRHGWGGRGAAARELVQQLLSESAAS